METFFWHVLYVLSKYRYTMYTYMYMYIVALSCTGCMAIRYMYMYIHRSTLGTTCTYTHRGRFVLHVHIHVHNYTFAGFHIVYNNDCGRHRFVLECKSNPSHYTITWTTDFVSVTNSKVFQFDNPLKLPV